jgi:hypothetical protein
VNLLTAFEYIVVWLLFFVECLSSFIATFAATKNLIARGGMTAAANNQGFLALSTLCGIGTFVFCLIQTRAQKK